MDRSSAEPWNPERRWADPLIATLALLIVFLLGGRTKVAGPRPPDAQVTLEGRLLDIALAAPKVLAGQPGKPVPAGLTLRGDWDRALVAVHAAEAGDLGAGLRFAESAGPSFQAAWRFAYQGHGSAPALQPITRALGNGYAAHMLAARCAERVGAAPGEHRRAAEAWLRPRALALGGAVLAGGCLLLAGVVFGVFVATSPSPAPLLSRFQLPGRALLLVLLGWFLALLVSPLASGLLIRMAPGLRPFALPLSYTFHATLGLGWLCMAEGIGPLELWRRVTPGRTGKAIVLSLGFFALALSAVLAVALVAKPLLPDAEPPQRALQEALARLQGPLVLTVTLLTVAVLAPVFEELVFRGVLLAWLDERLGRRFGAKTGRAAAVLASGLTFAAIHMEPMGLPTLGALGVVLGAAYLRGGSVVTPILVHGLWNGGLFLLLRAVSA